MSSLHEDLKQIDIQNEYLDNEVFTSQEILQLALIVTGISMFLYGFWSGTAAACFLVGFGATLTVSRIRAARTRHAIERAWHLRSNRHLAPAKRCSCVYCRSLHRMDSTTR